MQYRGSLSVAYYMKVFKLNLNWRNINLKYAMKYLNRIRPYVSVIYVHKTLDVIRPLRDRETNKKTLGA